MNKQKQIQILTIPKNLNYPPSDHTAILEQPNIVFMKTILNSALKHSTNKPKNFKIIRTVFNLHSSFFQSKYKIFENKVIQKLKILFVDIYKSEGHNSVYRQETKFEEASSNQLLDLQKKCVNIDKTSQFVLTLGNVNKNNENPLIKYLKNNPYKGFKLSLAFLNPSLNNVNIISVVKQLEEELRPFIELLEGEISKTMQDLNTVYYKFYIFYVINEYEMNDISDCLIKKRINSIVNNKAIFKELKRKTAGYLRGLQRLLILTFTENVSLEDANEMKLESSELVCGFFDAILEHVIEVLKRLMIEIDSTSDYKRKIFQILEDEFKKQKPGHILFLSNMIDKIKKFTTKFSNYVVLESSVLKLNCKKNMLETVIEVKDEKKNIAAFQEELK
ncbi:hypothetical protein CDIK_3064 [Cucumispora dikerogammari]|nr:hypothetical protein CDIK_3064 [Cucumispora dikerogammari]